MVGIDLVDITRIRLDDSFANRILTSEELEVFRSFSLEKRQREYLAGRFAAKEAIYKATQDIHYLHYSILNDETGKPYVKEHPEIAVSISHDADIAIAIAMIR